ncbi:membrane protein [Gallibacterium genomosp. 2]|uniref:Membrane protein n=2 Tax=Gallibacterium TaxID=155493 RepID=A0A0A2XLL1_9PAST|nr:MULTISPECIES: porin [Gallibacterium]KGQ31545.1 membrane protein [Gallibacterium genomosp. 2]OBX00658.1 membrane protein [Gallibacterium genomosp. 1]OBX01646.1 membrane protein [Gallibacterium genomosp. 1]
MKKTLVALAVAAVAATSANAAVVYNQDGTKVEVAGSFRVLLSKNTGERADLKNAGSRVIIKGTQDLGDGYSALANLEIRFDANDKKSFGDIEAKRVYAGFAKEGVGTLTFGKQPTNLDDVAVSDYTYDLGGIKQTKTDGDKVAKFRSADFAGFSFGLDYLFGEKNKDEFNNGSGFGVSAFYTTPEFAADTKLNFEAGFSQVKVDEYKNAPIKEHKVNAFLVGAELVSGPFSLGVDYSQKKATDDFDGIGYKFDKELHAEAIPFNKLRALEVGAKYKYLDNASLYGEYINGKATSADGEKYTKLNAYILGTDYWFTKSVVTYLEAGTFKYKNQASEKYNDNRVGVGFRVYF